MKPGEVAERLAKIADDIITIPSVPDYVTPTLTVIPLQLLAYHLAPSSWAVTWTNRETWRKASPWSNSLREAA